MEDPRYHLNFPAPQFPFVGHDSPDASLPSPEPGALPPKRRAGRKKFRETRHPVYRGVRRRNGSKWVCEVREPNKKTRIWLGTYPTPEMAARAHDVAALALRGRSACLNFADSAWLLPTPASLCAKDIRWTAMEAAKSFGTNEKDAMGAAENANAAEVAGGSAYLQEKMFFMDDEAEFGMPIFLDSMAEGMLLSPPSAIECASFDDDVDSHADVVQLWSYSLKGWGEFPLRRDGYDVHT